MIKDAKTKEIRKPPEAPTIAEIPELNPEKTGSPIIPIMRYMTVADTEIVGGKHPEIKKTAKS